MNTSGTTARGIPGPRSLDRRQFLGASGASALAVALASCTGGGQSSQEETSGGGDGRIQWWDQFRPLTQMLETELFEPYMAANEGVTIERRELAAADLGQALQVARRSNQLPDVHSLAGLDSAPAALVSEGWFQPISEFADFDASPVADQIFDGLHRFEGNVYSVPLFSARQHATIPWYNAELLEQAGVDPADEPVTWDDLRTIARQVKDNTDAHGIFLPAQNPNYLSAIVIQLAMAAGAPGEIDWRTGEYVQDSAPFVEAVEFLLSLQQDELVHPSSPAMIPRDAMARWAAGEGAIYPWGPWFIGDLASESPDVVERGLGCWSIPRPDSELRSVRSGPAGGVFWVSTDSAQPEVAADLLLQMTQEEFQSALATAMDQPPALLEVVETADVHPAYRDMVARFAEDVRIAPSPEIGHPEAWRVLAEMRPVEPGIGTMMQSALSGDDIDVAAELRTYREAMSAERERALEAVQGEGAEVDLDAWVFGNWDPESDYAIADYDAR
ncbi:ABC transporter substrate-binding protein [Ruania halotolerans]|uniref:ABC transporter substrate-binding protein n=1 Tax=Ruania halotolerans TaxID=2897773 RepID=UPI001E3A9B71|nr:extracellular solute-binding protein [Ruania halotolerans]UFU06625.1 extracellular solute-binding protein [Ruania halotolerans]